MKCLFERKIITMKTRKHFWRNSLIALGVVGGLTGTAVAQAASGTWTITAVDVGPHASWSEYGQSNKKKTSSNVASFNGDAEPAALGYKVHLINNKAQTRSNTVGLYINQTTHAGNNSGTVGYNYYSDVRSSVMEPNKTHVKLHFSADNK